MNSNKSVKEKELISNFEIFGLTVIFLIILVILFPKARLKEYILAEKSNYNLAKAYLKALVKAYPKNSDFVRYLIEFDLKLYDIKDAYKIISKYKNRFHDTAFEILSYKVVKELYFKTKNEKYKNEARKILFKLLNKRPLFVLKEARGFGFLKLEYQVFKKLNILNEDYLNLALYFKDYKTAKKIIDNLYNKQKDVKYLIKKAQIDEITGNFEEASRLYLIVYKKTKNIKYFKKAFYILVWNKKYKKAVFLAQSYENIFLKERRIDMLNDFLEFYLSIGLLKNARNLSLKSKKVLKI